MTTSPDTVNTAEAATTAEAINANQATPASARTTGGTVTATTRPQPRPARSDIAEEPNSRLQRFRGALFVAIPPAALVAAIPLMWGWGLGWHDVLIALAFYWLSGLGVTVGYPRVFPHGSFQVNDV